MVRTRTINAKNGNSKTLLTHSIPPEPSKEKKI
jgi:hypothetical protein